MTREETLAAEDIAEKVAKAVPDGAWAEVRVYGSGFSGGSVRVKIDRRTDANQGAKFEKVDGGDEPADDVKTAGCYAECRSGTCPVERCPSLKGDEGDASGIPADLRDGESMLEYVKRKERESWVGDSESKITDKAAAFLREGRRILTARGKEYDRPDGERSAIPAAKMWSALTGKTMTESEAWQFLSCLKLVRLATAPGPHDDSATDAAVYAALAGEAKHREAFEKLAFGVNPAWSAGKVAQPGDFDVKADDRADRNSRCGVGPVGGKATHSGFQTIGDKPQDDTTNRKPGPQEGVAPARLVGMLRELSSAVSTFLTKLENMESGHKHPERAAAWIEFSRLRQMVKSAKEACAAWAEGEPVSGGGALNFLRRFGGAEKVVQALDNLVRVVDAMPSDRRGCVTDTMGYGEAKNVALAWRDYPKSAAESRAAHDKTDHLPTVDAVALRQGRADKRFEFRVCNNGSTCPDWNDPAVGSVVSAAEWEKITGNLAPEWEKITGNLAPGEHSLGGNGWREGVWWRFVPREKKAEPTARIRTRCGDEKSDPRRVGFFVNTYPVTRDAYERLTGSPLMPGTAWAEYDGPTVYDADPKKLVEDVTGPKDTWRALGMEFLVSLVGSRLPIIPVDSRAKVVKMMKDIIDTDRNRHHEQASPRSQGAGT